MQIQFADTPGRPPRAVGLDFAVRGSRHRAGFKWLNSPQLRLGRRPSRRLNSCMKSKQNLFPALYEIASAGAVGVSALRGLGLDREARGFQAEMHADFSGIETAPGIILPWDQSSYGPAREAREARDMTAGTAGEGGNTIGTAIPEIGAALRANLVLEKLGARVLGGLTENICLPAAGASVAAAWRSETADEPETDTTFARLDLSPKRITAFIDVSDRLLRQQGAIEAFLVTELMDCLLYTSPSPRD